MEFLFSSDSFTMGSTLTFPGGCGARTLEHFEKSKMADDSQAISVSSIISLMEQIQTRSWCLNLCLWGCPIYWCRQKSKRAGGHLENPTWLPQSSIFDVKSLVQGMETWSWCLDLCLWGWPIYWCWPISAVGGGHLDKTYMDATGSSILHLKSLFQVIEM